MLTRLCFAVLALLPNLGSAAPRSGLYGFITLAASDVATVDPTTFLDAPLVDVYHVSICNCYSQPVAALEVRIRGEIVNNNTDFGLTFKETADLPTYGPFTVADTFFVVHENVSQVISLDWIDDGAELTATFVLAGEPRLIPSMAERVVAVLSVPAGSPTLDSSIVDVAIGFMERQLKIVSFPFAEFRSPCIPEPATGVLAGLALVSVASRRR